MHMVNGRVRHAEHWLAFQRTHDLSVWGESQRLNSIASFVPFANSFKFSTKPMDWATFTRCGMWMCEFDFENWLFILGLKYYLWQDWSPGWSLWSLLLLRYDLSKEMSTMAALNRFGIVVGGQYGSKFGQVHLWVGSCSVPPLSNTLHDLLTLYTGRHRLKTDTRP